MVRGMKAAKAGQYQLAVSELTQALRLEPDSAKTLNNRGYALSACQLYSRALADFDRAIELDPTFAAAWNNRGLARIAQADYARAITGEILHVDGGYHAMAAPRTQ